MTINRKKPNISRSRGFTLVELIVVLVIIGILLALVIPNLVGYIDKAQATACRKNRAELEKLYRYDTLLAEAEGTTTTMSAVLSSENGKRLTCPAGGTYALDVTTERLTCSIAKHGGSGITSMDPIANRVLEQLPKNINMDSGAENGNFTQQFIANLAAEGIDFAALGINSWAYRDNGSFYWTNADISELAPGDPVLVFRYNSKDDPATDDKKYYEGAYSVWEMKVALKDKSYNIIDINGKEVEDSKVYLATATEKQSFDTMNAIYLAELEKYYAAQSGARE